MAEIVVMLYKSKLRNHQLLLIINTFWLCVLFKEGPVSLLLDIELETQTALTGY